MEALALKYAESQFDETPLSFPVAVTLADKKMTSNGAAYQDKSNNDILFTTKGKMPDSGTLTLKEDGTYELTTVKVGNYTCKTTDGKTVSCSIE